MTALEDSSHTLRCSPAIPSGTVDVPPTDLSLRSLVHSARPILHSASTTDCTAYLSTNVSLAWTFSSFAYLVSTSAEDRLDCICIS